MRLEEIAKARSRHEGVIQALPGGDLSDTVGKRFTCEPRIGVRRIAMRALARPALTLRQQAIRKLLPAPLPVKADLLAIGERFASDAAWNYLLGKLPAANALNVLVPGCYMGGEDVQFWLRRGVKRLEGIDIMSLDRHWNAILPALQAKWDAGITFRQGSVEQIPFEADRFDVIATSAVLEHVRNLPAMVEETARVMKPGGYAIHDFGPLYYSFGADHCISAYGFDAGYDHLLLDQPSYRKRIENRDFFTSAAHNPELAYWALTDQFSFAVAKNYIDAFATRFEIAYVVAKISPQALQYREKFPDRWSRLLAADVDEADLLIKSLVVVVRKPSLRSQ